MPRNSEIVSTKQERIARLAKQSPQMAFTSLAYLMDIDWLKEAYRRTRKDGAVGVDGVTAEEYEQDREGNLQRLLDRAKSGTYHAPPVRRVHIPKGGSTTETRPLGIPTLEVWLPASTVGTPGARIIPKPDDELSGRLGTRG
jgi:retron-type reverse transcriptase